MLLGMHRSGTSVFTGTLNLVGCDGPKTIMPPNSSNPTGYWESLPICQFNDNLLEQSGTSWDDWEEFNPDWEESPKAPGLIAEAAELIRSEFENSPLFVLKDPRMCRLAPFWCRVLASLDIDVRVVVTTRNPLEVANSLLSRDDIAMDFGALMWLRHCLDAESATRELTRSITAYQDVLENSGSTLDRIQKDLGLKFPRLSNRVYVEISEFLQPSLRHHRVPDQSLLNSPVLSTWIRSTYEILCRWASEGENSQDYPELDRIRELLNEATPLFTRLVGQGKQERASAEETSKAIEEAEAGLAKVAQLEKALAAEQENSSELLQKRRADEEALLKMRSDLESLHYDVPMLKSALSQRSKEADDYLAEMTRLEDKTRQQEANREELVEELRQKRREIEELQAVQADAARKERSLEAKLAESEGKREQQVGEIVELMSRIIAAESAEARTEERLSAVISQREQTLREAQAGLDAEQSRTRELERQMGTEVQRLSSANALAERERDELSAARSGLERRMEDRFHEIASLTKMLRAQEARTDQERKNKLEAFNSAIMSMIDAAAPTFLPGRVRLRLQITALRRSGLFDAEWYKQAYPDVVDAAVVPEVHFIHAGAAEGRAPNGNI